MGKSQETALFALFHLGVHCGWSYKKTLLGYKCLTIKKMYLL